MRTSGGEPAVEFRVKITFSAIYPGCGKKISWNPPICTWLDETRSRE
jgi:hypothetical protein